MNEFLPYSFGMIDREKLVELRAQGKSLRAIAEAFGVCHQAVSQALARLETNRPPGRPRKPPKPKRPPGRPRKEAPAPALSDEPKRPRGRPKKSAKNPPENLQPGDEYTENGISKPSIHAGLEKKAGRPKEEVREEVRVRVKVDTARKIREKGNSWFREFLENSV